VFDPFHWLQPARDQARGGAGRGLAIVRDAVTAHGGQVWFADQAAGPRSTSGSRFPAPTAVPTAATAAPARAVAWGGRRRWTARRAARTLDHRRPPGAVEEDAMTTAAETTRASDAVPYWCCGNQYADDQVVRLGRHPEVAVCLGCARYLNRGQGARPGDSGHPAGQRGGAGGAPCRGPPAPAGPANHRRRAALAGPAPARIGVLPMAAFVPTAASGPRPPRSHPVGGTPRPAMLAR